METTKIATVKEIFNHIQKLNPEVSEVSSLGSYVSQSAQMVSDSLFNEAIESVSTDSLAYSILIKRNLLSEKQLWVISFELQKNQVYASKLKKENDYTEARYQQKKDESKQKLTANKENSQSLLDQVKSNGRKLADYYLFVKSNKKFAKEFYSKKFTQESVNSFLSL